MLTSKTSKNIGQYILLVTPHVIPNEVRDLQSVALFNKYI